MIEEHKIKISIHICRLLDNAKAQDERISSSERNES